MRKKFYNKFIIIIVVSIILALIISCNQDPSVGQEATLQAEEVETQSQNQQDGQLSLGEINAKISSLVNEVTPSVVSIQVEIITEGTFGQEEPQFGIGSGVILDEQGYILTNSHVVGEADTLLVVLDNGTLLEGTLIGADTVTDVGVIKIEAQDLQPAIFGSIENANVGEIVIAIGSPFGIQQTVTMGIISGKERTIPIATDQLPIVDAIQTDAAINPGNSGGPLVNINGEVIGINTIGVSPTGASAGIGFAIPIDTALNIAQQIIEYGRAVIPFMGVEMGPNITDVPGAFVEDVVQGAPAEKAGIEPGDVIVGYDDSEITTPSELLGQILRSNCDDVVTITLVRDGEAIELEVVLEECPIL
jgi:serine protease Do